MRNRFIIIDGNSLINRAYFAIQRPMITKEGIYTHAIYGFINMLNKLLDDYSAKYIAVAWDMKSPTFRHKAYEEYKAGRKKMPIELAMELPIMKDVLSAMNIGNLELEGFEADDIIGTLSRLGEEEDLETLIVTGDRDALQLCSDRTKVLITKKGISDFDLFDREKMIEVYQLTPEQFIDLKGLMGDKSDNIPGIPGVGQVTATKLLLQFNSIEKMYENTEAIQNKKLREKIEENVQLALMSKSLATINRYSPVDFNWEDLEYGEPDYEKLIEIYKKLEFNSFLKKLGSRNKAAAKRTTETDRTFKCIYLNDENDLPKSENLKSNDVYIKIISDNNHVGKPEVFAAGLLIDDRMYYCEGQVDKEVDCIKKYIFDNRLNLCGYFLTDSLYVMGFSEDENYNISYDGAISEYLLNPTRSGYEFENILFDKLGIDITKEKELLESLSVQKLGNDNREMAEDYFKRYFSGMLSLRKEHEKLIAEEDLEDVLVNVELPLIEPLTAMEKVGFRCEGNILEEIGKTFDSTIDLLQEEIYGFAGKEFNINSPAQLGTILFEDLKLPVIKKTKRGYSTSADVLEKLREDHPIIDKITEFRKLTKLKSTYVDGLTPLISKDGRIHPHLRQTVAATGRISCTEPNLQNIPIRSEEGRSLRKAFLPSEGNLLVGADYSQIELRVLAHLTEDEVMLDAFNKGDDIHRITASRVFNIPYEEVTSLDRSRAKAVNFGVIYGMSGFGLSEELSISRKDADEYIKDYFAKHPKVKAYMDEQIRLCKENGYTSTICGRKRYIPEITASNFMTRQLGERLAMNSPIQGSAADIIKLAMISVHTSLKKMNLKSRLILQIHDELIIDTFEDELEEVKALLKKNMEEAIKLKVNLLAEVNVGENWYALK